jgi:hypothetical protein
MKRGGPMKRSVLRRISEKRKQIVGYVWSTLKARNEKRIRERREAAYGAKAKWIRTLPCHICATWGVPQQDRTVAAHCEKTRGAGGTSGHLIPLCVDHEQRFHGMGRESFQIAYKMSLADATAVYDAFWRREQDAA